MVMGLSDYPIDILLLTFSLWSPRSPTQQWIIADGGDDYHGAAATSKMSRGVKRRDGRFALFYCCGSLQL